MKEKFKRKTPKPPKPYRIIYLHAKLTNLLTNDFVGIFISWNKGQNAGLVDLDQKVHTIVNPESNHHNQN